jgi:hypothetical protein
VLCRQAACGRCRACACCAVGHCQHLPQLLQVPQHLARHAGAAAGLRHAPHTHARARPPSLHASCCCHRAPNSCDLRAELPRAMCPCGLGGH